MDKTAEYMQQVEEMYDSGTKSGYSHLLVLRLQDGEIDARYVAPGEDFHATLNALSSSDKQVVIEVYDIQEDLDAQIDQAKCWRVPPRSGITDRLHPSTVKAVQAVKASALAYDAAVSVLTETMPTIDKMKGAELSRLLSDLRDAGLPDCAVSTAIKQRLSELNDS